MSPQFEVSTQIGTQRLYRARTEVRRVGTAQGIRCGQVDKREAESWEDHLLGTRCLVWAECSRLAEPLRAPPLLARLDNHACSCAELGSIRSCALCATVAELAFGGFPPFSPRPKVHGISEGRAITARLLKRVFSDDGYGNIHRGKLHSVPCRSSVLRWLNGRCHRAGVALTVRQASLMLASPPEGWKHDRQACQVAAGHRKG